MGRKYYYSILIWKNGDVMKCIKINLPARNALFLSIWTKNDPKIETWSAFFVSILINLTHLCLFFRSTVFYIEGRNPKDTQKSILFNKWAFFVSLSYLNPFSSPLIKSFFIKFCFLKIRKILKDNKNIAPWDITQEPKYPLLCAQISLCAGGKVPRHAAIVRQ